MTRTVGSDGGYTHTAPVLNTAMEWEENAWQGLDYICQFVVNNAMIVAEKTRLKRDAADAIFWSLFPYLKCVCPCLCDALHFIPLKFGLALWYLKKLM